MRPSAKYPHLQPRTPAQFNGIYVSTGHTPINMKTTASPSGQVAYALFKTDGTRNRVTRILTAPTRFEDWRLGTVISLRHATDSRELGEYMVVGVRDIDSGEDAGDVPNRLIVHSPLAWA